MNVKLKFTYLVLLSLFVFPQLSSAQKHFEPFKFAVIADPHMSVPSENSPANGTKMFKNSVELLEATINEINKQKDIDFTVVLGDLTTEVWETAKANTLAATITSWPRTSETPNTSEGNKLLEDIMLSDNTKAGVINLHPSLLSAVSK